MAEESTPPEGGGGKKKGGLFKNKKSLYIVGGIALLGVVFVAVHSANKSANDAAGASTSSGLQPSDMMGINPSTGYLYGSPADSAASSGQVGPAGPQGPPGPAGPAGPTGPVKTTLPGKLPGKPPKPTGGGHHPKPPSHSYVVKPNDTLTAIAAHFHTSWQHIYSMNKAVIGKNPNRIHPGQKLKVA